MTEDKMSALMKLKELLDSEVITREEFEQQKRNILESKGTVSHTSSEKTPPVHNPKSNHTNKKWIYVGVGGAIILAIVLVIIFNGDKTPSHNPEISDESEYAIPSDEEQIAELQNLYTDIPEETFEEQFDTFNPWRVEHFLNEWGEETEHKFLSTVIQASGWNINIQYKPGDTQLPQGAFRFSIVDDDGHTEEMWDPVNIYIRGSDGETKAVEVTGVRDNLAFVEDPNTVAALKYYFDQENFDIRMEFEKYLERHTSQGRWESTPGFFQRAIETML